jgi:hypothetical protein
MTGKPSSSATKILSAMGLDVIVLSTRWLSVSLLAALDRLSDWLKTSIVNHVTNRTTIEWLLWYCWDRLFLDRNA